jgi:hypothetical protein
MKITRINIGMMIVGCAFVCCLTLTLSAQTHPHLTISKPSSSAVQVNWTNQIGTSYHVLFSTNLAEPFVLLEDAFSPDTLVTVYASTSDSPVGFFRIQVPTNTPTTNVLIFSPSNTVAVSGEIAVRMGAQLGTQVQGVNLYLDDALVGYLNSGGMNFTLDTTHFANGTHTVYVGAVDTANNETLSSSITLDFENSVRWLDACSMFNSFVPIDVTADFYPADWLVTVTDTNGTIVRTITGSTSDGNIATSWDGTDDNSQLLSVENLYNIQVDVTASSSSSLMMASTVFSSLSSSLGASSVSSHNNPHGVPEYTMVKPASNPLTAYLHIMSIYQGLTPQEKLIYPPLPARPASNPYATIATKMSARDMFLALHKKSGSTLTSAAGTATPYAGASLQFASTKTLAWWENPWSSKQTAIARVPFAGVLGTTIAGDCNQISALIEAADGVAGNNRGVLNTTVQLVQNSSDVTTLKNNILNPNVTALYFVGHGNTNANAFGATTTGIFASNLAALCGNNYYPSLPQSVGVFAGKPGFVTHKPFNFVFLDGCNTGSGDLPEAFGIPKAVKAIEYDSPHSELHKRAFIGWSGEVAFQFDQSHINWSLKFWSTWLDGNGYDTTVSSAIIAAYADQPSVNSNVPAKSYGSRQLTWSN